MSATLKVKKNTEHLLCKKIVQRAKYKAKIEILMHLKNSLCIKELNAEGRFYVNKLIKTYRNDLERIENDIN